MSQFTPSGSGGAPSSPVTLEGVGNPTTANVSLPLAATEYSYPLPAGTQKFLLKLRGYAANLQLAYAAGTSGTTYLTVPRGCHYGVDGLDGAATITLYFQSDIAGQVAEIESWG